MIKKKPREQPPAPATSDSDHRSAPTGANVTNNFSITVPEGTKPELLRDTIQRALSESLQMAAKVKFSDTGWGPELGSVLDPGDKFTFTKGAETFCPVPYNSFTVGPFSTTVTVRKGESMEEVYVRAYRFLMQVFEADFEIQKKQFWERLAESGENKPGKAKG